MRQRFGQVVYWLTAAAQIPRKPQRYSLRWQNGELSGVYQAIFSNVHRYGGGLVVNADAVPTDGWLDMAVFTWKGYLARVPQLLAVVPCAWARRLPGPLRARVRQAEVRAEGRLWAHVDGEPFLTENPSLSMRAGAVWVLQGARGQRVTL